METAEQLRSRIAVARLRQQKTSARTTELLQEVEQAGERQCLRDQLQNIESNISRRNRLNKYHEDFKTAIDNDEEDIDNHESDPGSFDVFKPPFQTTSGEDLADYSADVVKGEYVVKIKGMSWLVSALQQESSHYFESVLFSIGDDDFTIVYNPKGGQVGIASANDKQFGSLALRHIESRGITFRHKFLVKDASGDYIQWGETGDECNPKWNVMGKAFGPDVQVVASGSPPEYQIGVFGLTHDELVQSQFVCDDTLIAKVQLEVRPYVSSGCYKKLKHRIELPGTSIDANLLTLLQTGKHSDVTFIVNGESIPAHAAILSARSEVFDRELECGMRESISREIRIDDCDATIFRAMLQFLYTDDFKCIDDTIKAAANAASVDTISSSTCSSINLCSSMIQNLLAVSHKYQVQRLQLWCEQQLCERICVNDVCDIICQAHLHEARQLEQACLAFIKESMGAVVGTPAFGRLTEDWPEIMLKINIYVAGISDCEATRAIKAQQERRESRQRVETDADDDEKAGKRQRTE